MIVFVLSFISSTLKSTTLCEPDNLIISSRILQSLLNDHFNSTPFVLQSTSLFFSQNKWFLIHCKYATLTIDSWVFQVVNLSFNWIPYKSYHHRTSFAFFYKCDAMFALAYLSHLCYPVYLPTWLNFNLLPSIDKKKTILQNYII